MSPRRMRKRCAGGWSAPSAAICGGQSRTPDKSAGGRANPHHGVVVSSTTANLPAASGSRCPRARRARSRGRGNANRRPASCRWLRGRERQCAPLLPAARPDQSEWPLRMLEADRGVDHGVGGKEQFFAAGTQMHRHVAWCVTGSVDGDRARRHLRSSFDQAKPGTGQFQIRPGDLRLERRRYFGGQFRGVPEFDLGLACDEFGRGE